MGVKNFKIRKILQDLKSEKKIFFFLIAFAIFSLVSMKASPAEDFSSEMNKFPLVLIGAFILIFFLTILLTRAYSLKKKADHFLSMQKLEIQSQKEEIEHKNKEITEGIIYARRIQSAILPNPRKLDKILDDYFVYFKPKEIVSGDFYWIEKRAKKIMFAAVDCTGHGVPGALMSIIAYEGLNRAINEFEITKSDKIVNVLNDSVSETLRHTGSVDIKDGLDLSLCVINQDTMLLEYTGAKNPVYIIRKSKTLDIDNSPSQPKTSNGSNNLYEIKGDRMSIEQSSKLKRFTPHKVQLKKGDRIFVFTDGFPDQFGGELGKKLSYSSFRNILLDIQDLSMSEQKDQLEIQLEKWQGNHEQLDDILIIGVKV